MSAILWVWENLTLDVLSQVTIFVGAIAVLFLGGGNRWGFVFGLLSQPGWYYTTIVHEQWGVLAACVIYTLGWAMGFYRTFIKKQG